MAAGGVDVGAAGVSDRRLDADTLEALQELLRLLGRGGLEGGAGDLVELDEVDVAERSTAEIAKGVDLFLSIVDASDEGVLVGGAATGLVDVLAERRIEVDEREPLDTGHEGVAGLLHRRMQRHRQRELLGLVGEPEDLGNKTAGGDREMAGSDVEGGRVVELAQRLERGVVVCERLALTHEDDARHTGIEVVAHMHDLLVDLTRREGAVEAVLSRGTKCATHCASSLRRNADRELAARGHADALHGGAITEAQQVFAASICGNLTGDLLGAERCDTLGQGLAERLGKVGHLVGRARALVPNPILDLLGAERGLPELLHEGEQLSMRDGVEVERGGGDVKVLFCHGRLPSL